MTPKQTLLLWCVLGRQGEALQGELAPKVEKKDRDHLVAQGLIAVGKLGRALTIKLTDKGWRWAGEHLGDELPANYRVLQQWLTMLQRRFEAKGDTLAEFIGTAPELAAPPAKKSARKAPAKPRASRGKGAAKPPADLRARIEQAYLVVTDGHKDRPAPLSLLRAQLADLGRAALDAELLRILQSDEKARLVQISDPKAISADERAAAFNPGGEPYHILWIQS